MANQEVLKKLTKARAALILDEPFFGALALRLRLVEENSLPTLAVDGKHIFYNAEFVNSLSLDLVKSALAHEVGHCVFQHIGRRGTRDHVRWNHAGDYVINDMIKQAGFTLGDSWLYNPAYANMTADAVYNALPPAVNSNNPQYGNGSAAGALCDIQDGSADPSIKAEDQRNWQIATIQAANAAKQAGKLPGGMERFLEDMMKPKIDWKERLRQFMTQIAKDDYDWSRPNKKLLQYGLVLPTLYSEEAGAIACVVDDSGSIDNKTLNAFASEFRNIVEDVKPSTSHLIYCDAQIGGRYDVERGEELPKFKIHGGGGTDFRPPFIDIEERQLEVQCLVYLTDGYGPFPKDPPPYPVLWVMTSDIKAPWGETIPIEINE